MTPKAQAKKEKYRERACQMPSNQNTVLLDYSQLLSLSLISGTHVLFCLNSVYSQNQIKGWQTMAHWPKLATA